MRLMCAWLLEKMAKKESHYYYGTLCLRNEKSWTKCEIETASWLSHSLQQSYAFKLLYDGSLCFISAVYNISRDQMFYFYTLQYFTWSDVTRLFKLIAYNFGTIYERRTYNIIFFDVNIFILIIFTLQVSIQTEIGNKSVYDSGQLWGKLLIDIETFVGWLLVNEMSNCKIKLLYSLQIGIHFLPINMNEPFRNFATTNLVVNGL
jgi:hypothetical protein